MRVALRCWAAAVAAVCVSGQPAINLTGSWLLEASHLEVYTIASTSNPAYWAVKCSQGPCSAWKHAAINVTDASSGACTVAFDSGLVHTGVIDVPSSDAIIWSDRSTWARTLPPGTVLDVHILPHSHNDPGWKSTMDQLYNESIRTIYTAFVSELARVPARTYAAEIGCFWAEWWADPQVNDTMRSLALKAVAAGQMEFMGGGWSQNDEATVRFEDTVDNMALGHLWAQSVLGSPPVTAAWQADPFGHSSTQAYVYSLLAMDGYVFGRPMQDDPITTAQSAALWHPTASFPDRGSFDAATLLTHDHFLGYWEPYRDLHQFLASGDTTAVVQGLTAAVQAKAAKRPNLKTILLMFGDDFAWFDAPAVYATLDDAIAAMNGTNTTVGLIMNVQYSTPSRWLAALAAEVGATTSAGAGKAGKAVTDTASLAPASPFPGFPSRPAWDMMPLIGCEFPRPWTGFYTSRPEYKGQYRAGGAVMRAANQLHTLARDEGQWLEQAARLSVLWRAVGLVQHHDAITGDAWDPVMEDYRVRVDEGMGNASVVMGQAVGRLQGLQDGAALPSACFNTSSLPCQPITDALTNGRPATVTAYNPLGWTRDEWVEVVVPNASVVVTDGTTGEPIPSQTTITVPGWVPPEYGPGPWYSLIFKAANLPPIGYKTYSVSTAQAGAAGASTACPRQPITPGPTPDWTLTLPGSPLSLSFNGSGVLVGMVYTDPSTPSNPINIAATATVLEYTTTPGWENAWDFSTNGTGPESAAPFPGAATAPFTATQGCPLVNEVVTETDPAHGVRTRYRLYAGEDVAHVYTSTGPFATATAPLSHDPILRVTTNLTTTGYFWSDSNGLELLPRAWNARPWWNGSYVDSNDPVTSNYYPVAAGLVLKDEGSGTVFAVMTGRSDGLGSPQGGSSTGDGVLEVAVNRVVLDNTNTSVTGNRTVTVHNVLLVRGSWGEGTAAFRAWDTRLASPVLVLAADGGWPVPVPTWSGIVAPLPPTVQLLSLQTLPPGANVGLSFAKLAAMTAGGSTAADPPLATATVLARLRHIMAAGEGDGSAQPVTVDLNMFTPFNTAGLTETTLSLTRTMAAARQEQWQWPQLGAGGRRADDDSDGRGTDGAGLSATSVGLAPLDVKTFVLSLSQ